MSHLPRASSSPTRSLTSFVVFSALNRAPRHHVAPSRLYFLDEGLYSLEHPNIYCTPLRLADIRDWDTREFERNVDAEICVNLKALLGDVRLLEMRIMIPWKDRRNVEVAKNVHGRFQGRRREADRGARSVSDRSR